MSIADEATWRMPRQMLSDITTISSIRPGAVRADHPLRPAGQHTCLALHGTLSDLVAFVCAADLVLREQDDTAEAAALLTRLHREEAPGGGEVYFWPLLAVEDGQV